MKNSDLLLSIIRGEKVEVIDGNFDFFLGEEKEISERNKRKSVINLFEDSESFFPLETVKIYNRLGRSILKSYY